jgi:hypothetical protein
MQKWQGAATGGCNVASVPLDEALSFAYNVLAYSPDTLTDSEFGVKNPIEVLYTPQFDR